METDQSIPANAGSTEFDVPLGDHPLEIAARRGIGPLSAQAQKVWHGESVPCVSCGQLVRRGVAECEDCGQDLSEEMIEKMRGHAGPWYVLEHLRPFPGVSLERIIKQIRRGLITEVSIVRGPSTDYQWRFAIEAPGLCRYFGKCWHCHHPVSPSDIYCPACLSYLSFEKPSDPRAFARLDATLTPPAADFRSPKATNPPGAFSTAEPRAATRPVATFPSEIRNEGPFLASPPRPAPLDHARPAPAARSSAAPSSSPELARLADAVHALEVAPRSEGAPNRLSPAATTVIAVVILSVGLLLLIWGISTRSRPLPRSERIGTPTQVAPAPPSQRTAPPSP